MNKHGRAHVIIKKTTAGVQKGAWRFTIIAANGEPLTTSEGYTSKQDAKRGTRDLFEALWQIIMANMRSR